MFWVRKIPQGLIRLYQSLISPVIHFLVGSEWGCRFSPSCSEYFRIAIQERGFFYGVWLGMGRVLRCHPFCSGGYDPVPLSKLECVTRNCQNKGS